ncbi:hypothetical protein RhiirA5_411258 [Rhizophagus irregularis]|uniref:Uncharacterized protein n=1 Tax=Rhizophagus irregularis TaxID=588596 RepID=A0A2I1E2A5_9GLOM|nr:hypothetical protein RhiirA5_411258 [Rhizophagus irregularis]PKC69788.1 hypothetical protein RhiirA1_455557 [Rhizophagus irregularis]PKY16258.1 hypothetical protein RhiirB3_428595 [Rhizophagus irregularis]
MVKPVWNTPNCDINLKEVQALMHLHLHYKHDYETPEMWCSHIRAPFKKFLKDNPRWENSSVEKEYRNLSLKRQISVTETEMKRLQPEITSQSLILVIPLISTV